MIRIRKYYGAGIALFRLFGTEYEIFLGKRSIKRGFGKWSIPGGKYEDEDYSYLGCANREFKEEIGCLVPDGEILGIKAFHYPCFHWKTFIMFTDDSITNCRLSEFSESKWIPLKDLDKYELCFGVKQEVRKFLALEKTNRETIRDIIIKSDEEVINAAKKEQRYISNKLTPAYLQRVLGIGYSHAVRTINLLNEK